MDKISWKKYGFWKKYDKPFTQLDLWNSCNLRCSFCYYDSERKQNDYFKDLDLIKNQINEIWKKSNYVSILWWETLLHPDFWEIMDILNNKWLIVGVVSSWYFFWDKKIMKKLLSYDNLDVITISIHTIFENEWEKIYWEKNIVSKLLSWLDWLLDWVKKYNSNINVINYITWNKYNYKNTHKVIDYVNNKWIKIIQISWIHAYSSFGFSINNYNSLVPYIFLKNTFENIKPLLNKGLIIMVKGFPLCVHRFFIDYNYWIKEFMFWETYDSKLDSVWEKVWDNQMDYKITLDKCKKCYAYKKYCFWVYKFYYKKYKDKELKSLSKREVELLKNKKFDNLQNYYSQKNKKLYE